MDERLNSLPVELAVKITISPSGCWFWLGTVNQAGYGMASYNSKWTIAENIAHRLAYRLLVGPIPSDKVLHHTCFEPRCCNPEHLQILTPSEHSRLHAEDRARMREYIERGLIG